MYKKIIFTPNAPWPKGPYSQAVSYNGILYISGQIPLDPKSGEIISGNIEVQARQVLENLKAIAEASGAKMHDVLKVNCYLSDMNDFEGFNKIYAEYFPEEPPARTTLQAEKLPGNVRLEIDVIVKLNKRI